MNFLHSKLLMVDISLNCSSGWSSLTFSCPGSLHCLELKASELYASIKDLIPGQSYHFPDPQQVVDLLHRKILHLHQHHILQRTSQFPCQKSCILNNTNESLFAEIDSPLKNVTVIRVTDDANLESYERMCPTIVIIHGLLRKHHLHRQHQGQMQ